MVVVKLTMMRYQVNYSLACIIWKLIVCRNLELALWCLLAGVFIARGREDVLVTKNLVPGDSVYNEKRIQVEVGGLSVRSLVVIELCDHVGVLQSHGG